MEGRERFVDVRAGEESRMRPADARRLGYRVARAQAEAASARQVGVLEAERTFSGRAPR